ncbi:MAG: M13 family metallopeptidase [Holophagales bacterium]|nr:MAG: M13 family metallopeptidase [Holophagales bacterium]
MSAIRLAALATLTLGLAGPALATDLPPAAGQSTIAQQVLSSMDLKADPCQDFYRYACGGWLDSTKLPADQARWTRSFSTISERNREIVRTILDEAAAAPGTDPHAERALVGNYYAACMDEPAVEKAGTTPLAPWLAEIDKVSDPASLFAVAGKLHRAGANTLFGAGPVPDFKNPELNILFLIQGGLGMPERDYYVSEDPTKKELMQKYEAHVARMLGLLGTPAAQAAADAKAIVAFETELARASRPNTEMRQIEKLYHPVDRAGLTKVAPGLPWDRYFEAIGFPALADLNVATPEFFTALEKLAATTPLPTLRAYLRWSAVNSAADQLAKPFVDANFDFYGKTLSGQAEIQPRWKRCVAATTGALGEAIGKVYVDREFAGDSKEKALEMIHDIETAFVNSLPRLRWMDDATRERAKEKSLAIANKIGYPDKWRDYSTMNVGRTSYFDNTVSGSIFEFDRQMRKVGKPVDRTEWGMTPQTVNASYNPLQNEISFPAGILQPPFFHRDFPAALNYGGIGAVVGHELTHGFDDMGRKFDSKGQLREWWAPEVAARFEGQTSCVKDFYSKFEVEPGAKVNGELTLGENIADLGGLKQAYAAYKIWEKRHGPPPPAVPGLTNEQLLFVGWAQVWCTVAAPEFLRQQVATDPHSPGHFRAIGAPMNNPAFFEAFSCKAGTPMHPADICTVW